MQTRRYLTAALTCAACTGVAGANGAAGAAAEDQASDRRPVEKIVVTSHPLSAEGLALSSEILEGEELARDLESSIGETVGRQPGVHAASFGQAASRPVIHGLSGPRVRIMEDRIDSLDVSVTSADHAVTIEPFIADRIEVLKGPSTLLYGSGAIGGVVDVHTGRIPHNEAAQPISGRAEIRYGENGDRETAAARLDGGAGMLAWHLDGFTREAEPYDIPGFAESDALRALEEAEEAGEAHDEDHDEARGTLPGSGLDVQGGAGGLSLVGDRGFAGVAVSTLEAVYGLPGGHGHEGEEEEEEAEAHGAQTPTLDIEQTRIDLEAGLADPLPGFTSLNVRIGINDYEHREIEPNGEVATTFDNEAVEGRVELNHAPVAGWSGALGVQYTDRDFAAFGEEAFIAPVDTRSVGAFWVGERTFERFDLEGGVRLETVEVDPSTGDRREFDGYAVSLGMVLPIGNAWSLGLLADYTARAPIAEELFSDGPHLATRAFEIGNPDLDEEKALNLSANLRYAGERWFLNTSLYYNDFSDFIYEAATGAEEDGLPVFVYTQDDAEFVGLDFETRVTAFTWQGGELDVSATFDTVSGEVNAAGDDDLPRIPPTRYGLGLAGTWGLARFSLDHTWVREQDDVAAFELPTDSYRDLRAYLGVDLPVGGSRITLFVQGRNLTDDEQRQHSSFIKDLAPQPGRSVEAGVRARF